MNGLELIKHTAGGGVMTASGAPGGAVSLVKNGKIEFENATVINVDKCFDVPANPGDEPLYDNYLVVTRLLTDAQRIPLYRLRASGTDTSSTTYTQQQLVANSTSVTGDRDTSQTSIRFLQTASTNMNGFHAYFYGPSLSQPTASRTVTSSAVSGAQIFDMAGTQSGSTSFDGFTMFVGAGHMTGSLTIYGFTKGQTP